MATTRKMYPHAGPRFAVSTVAYPTVSPVNPPSVDQFSHVPAGSEASPPRVGSTYVRATRGIAISRPFGIT